MRKLSRQWGALSFEKKLSIIVAPLLLAIVSGVLVPLLNRQTEKIGKGEPPKAASNLEIVDLAVTGGVAPACLSDPPTNPQRIDITVRNTGNVVAVAKRMGFRVGAFGLLEIPQAGGGLEPSKDYTVLLPPNPRIGQMVASKISQQIPPKGVDRFTARIDVPEPDRQLGSHLYQLDVLLYHDTSTTPIDAGTVLVAAPFLPEKSLFQAGIPPESRAGFEGSGPLQTMQQNEATFRRMFALPGERAPALTLDLVNVPTTSKSNPCRPPK